MIISSRQYKITALYCKHPIWCIKPGFASWLWFWLYLSCLLLNPVYPKTGISLMIWSLQVITSGNFTPAPYGPSLDREYKDGYVSGCRKQIWSTFLYKKDTLLPSKGSKSCNSVFKERGKGGGIGKPPLLEVMSQGQTGSYLTDCHSSLERHVMCSVRRTPSMAQGTL